MKKSSLPTDVLHRIASLTAMKVRSANDGPYAWSQSERRIAVELIKKLVYGRPSKLLVPRLRHEFYGLRDADGDEIYEGVETDQYVGLRLEQQELIERSHMAAYEQVLSAVAS